jgi:hypothetical protein
MTAIRLTMGSQAATWLNNPQADGASTASTQPVNVWQNGVPRAMPEQRPPYQGVRNDMPPLAPRSPPNSPCFMHLVRLALTRSRCAQLRT